MSKISNNYASFRSARRRQLVERLAYCETRSEIARRYLSAAEEQKSARLDFWADALDAAESAEAEARRAVSRFDAIDVKFERRQFELLLALRSATNAQFANE